MGDAIENDTSGQHGSDEQPDDATSSATDDSSVGFGNRLDDEDDGETSEPSLQDAHNPETDEDTSSGGPAD
jgi:hypothetical protein